MNKLIVYSGGADSTLLLYNELLLWKYREFSPPYIKTISFNSPAFPGSFHQKMRREKFKKYMFDSRKIQWDSKEIDISNITNGIQIYGMPQQTLWMTLSLYMAYDKDEILFGYIREDDYWKECKIFEEIFNKSKILIGKPNCSMSYPLNFEYKHDIINRIKEHRLEPYIWICQSVEPFNTSDIPTDEQQPCGKCDYCLKWIVNEKFLELRGDLGTAKCKIDLGIYVDSIKEK